MQQRFSDSPVSGNAAAPEMVANTAIVSDSPRRSQKKEQEAVLRQLWDEFARLNDSFFNNTLSLKEIRLSTRKQYGGYYRKGDSLIVLSWPSYQAFGWEETLNTFRHEVAHIVHNDHSRSFWQLAEQLGSTQKYARIPDNREHAYCRFVYECPVCKNRVFRRRRLLRSSCARCDRQYNPAFALKLISSPITRETEKQRKR